MKERWYYFRIKVALKFLRLMTKPYRWCMMHSSIERRSEALRITMKICDALEPHENEFLEARLIRITYLLIGLAGVIDGCNQLGINYQSLLTQNN